MQTSWSHGQANPNEDDTSLKKLINQVWEEWHNENLSQSTKIIGIESNDVTRSVIP
jgi:hypothetical protein